MGYETIITSNAPEFTPRRGVVSITVHATHDAAMLHANRVNNERDAQRAAFPRYAHVRKAGE